MAMKDRHDRQTKCYAKVYGALVQECWHNQNLQPTSVAKVRLIHNINLDIYLR